MLWRLVAFSSGDPGYLALTDDRQQAIGLYTADGTPVEQAEYETTDENATPPACAGSVVSPSPAIAAPTPVIISAADFILLFSPQEAVSVKDSSDPVVEQFMLALSVASEVNLSGPVIQRGISYLLTTGLLTSDRAAAILAGTPYAP